MKKNVYFLCLNAIRFTPYAYGMLRGYVEQHPRIRAAYDWAPPIWKMTPVEEIVTDIRQPDVLCGSCYVWNHNHHCAVARRVKARHPECRVIFGGPHVPLDDPEYFRKHPYVDILVRHEGELPLEQLLLRELDGVPDLADIPGIAFNDGGRFVKTGGNPRLPRKLPVPSPYLAGFLDDFIADSGAATIALWETNRGCPHSCSFCDWGVRTMNQLRLHDVDKVIAEIDFMASRRVEDIYVTDCNFGLFKRDLSLAEKLVASKQATGYPKRVRIQFAKNSNDTVFKISKLLNDNDMLWGTTLSMQSVDMNVLAAVNRGHIGIDNYKDLKERYSNHGIPTYTELILGLPLETRDSFIDGICALFDIGIHDDIRVFELALLPNAPISRPAERKQYGLMTREKPLRLPAPGSVRESVELVVGTSTMPTADWAYCLLFGEAIQALHNGGYTRLLAIYLNDALGVSYRRFYDGLLSYLLGASADAAKGFHRLRTLIDEFRDDPDMPQIHRLLTQPDIMAFLDSYNPRRKGWPLWTYLWLWLAEHREDFYRVVRNFLREIRLAPSPLLEDLIHYQQELMVTLDFDPDVGKTCETTHTWHDYFFKGAPLTNNPCRLRYADRFMGVSHRFRLVPGDRLAFTRAAIGMSYPYSKHRHFFHQPESTEVSYPQ